MLSSDESWYAATALQVFQKYKQSLLESYMEDNAKVRFCPSVPWCSRAVEVRSSSADADAGCHIAITRMTQPQCMTIASVLAP
jgi:hypothetical protein